MVKIFSNFDTNLARNLVIRYAQQYGQDRVIFVKRWTVYLVFNVLFPLFIWSLVLGLGLLIYIRSLEIDPFFTLFVRLILAVLVFIRFWILYRAVTGLINYYMDFTIVTPQQIISYDQIGVFSRNTRAVEIDKIKLVSVDKKWLLRSIFNYGAIVFFAEWDGKFGDLGLDYISHPVELRDKIAVVMGMSTVE